MLTIGKLGAGQEGYYLSKVAGGIEDYYTGAGESQGVWLGHGAARLGLDGEVASDALRAVLAGLDPTTGERLAGQGGHRRVPGWDLTFSAPKSVSVLYGLGDPDVAAAVSAAHEEAVAAGVGYLERHATVSRRRAEGRIEMIRGVGLVVAAFRHRTSRAGDPQLHTHCLAANLVERVDGGFGALHSPVIYRHARTAGFLYQAVLRAELAEALGVTWRPVRNGYAEIDGIDPRLLSCFSKRRAEIEAAMVERGENSAQAAQVAAVRTRQAKDYSVDAESLTERWRAEAAALGVEPGSVLDALGRRTEAWTQADLDALVEELTSSAGLTFSHASFDRADVTRAWCESLPAAAGADLDAIEGLTEMLLTDHHVVPIADGTSRLDLSQVVHDADGAAVTAVAVERRWSTTEMLAVEADLLERSTTARSSGVGQVSRTLVDGVLADRSELSNEQQTMVRRLTTSGHGVEVVVGRAGSGKTYGLAAAASVWRAGGYQPIGVALAARAAAELESQAGLPATTVAQFLLDCDQGGPLVLTDRNVVVVDEAGMVDTRRLARLVRHTQSVGAKLVLIGDHHQLPSVEAGGAFAVLAERLDPIELRENRRQRELWERQTLDRLRVGAGGRVGAQDIITAYGEHDRLHIGATPAQVRAEMVQDWYQARSAGDEVAMLALRRSDVAELNCRARALLVADGSVQPEGVTNGEQTFGIGDRVVCLDNDRRLGVHNALFGTIAAVNVDTGEVVLKTEESGDRLLLPSDYVGAHLDHAYATTIHKAQGSTVDRTFLLGDDRLYRQGAYTGLSRGRARNDLYLVTDDDRDHDPELEPHGTEPDDDSALDRLARALHRDGAKQLASREAADLADDHQLTSLAQLWRERDQSPSPDERDLGALDQLIRQRTMAAGRACELLRPRQVTEVIGEPPVGLPARQRWRDTAAEIVSFRARWDIGQDIALEQLEASTAGEDEHLRSVLNAVAAVAEQPGFAEPATPGTGIEL